MIIESLTSGVITVGNGRGFVVEGAGERLVITAAHCLPSLPPALSSFGIESRTYGPLLALRGEEPRAWAVCRFVDPIADIAVLGSPDNPHADDYNALMGTATALSFGDAVHRPVNFWAPARLLSLDGRWFSCTIRHFGGPAVDHPCCRAGAWRNVGLADCRRGRHGGRGYLHHDIAQRRRPQRAPFPQPAGMAAPRHFLSGPAYGGPP